MRRPRPATVLVAGGGIVGLSFAAAVKAALDQRVEIAVHDPAFETGPVQGDDRFFAIVPASRAFLAHLGVWETIAPEAQPILRMEITDSRLSDPVRPPFLSFGDDGPDGEPLAWMIGSGVLRDALLARARALGVTLAGGSIRGLDRSGPRTAARLASGAAILADLVVAADGRRSRLRESLGIGWVGRPYGQHGIVATISHERDHGGRAIQHFLPSGPFAILPLTPGGALGHRSSIVWSERDDHVDMLRHLDEDDVLMEVRRRFGDEFGAISLETPISPHPLAVGVARRLVDDRFALIGDAAHVIHPIAGQGLNLGLADAWALSEGVRDSLRLGLEAGDANMLRAYEQARRPAAFRMGLATDGLNRLFSNDVLPVRLARDLGLGLVERMPRVKDFFMRQAAGHRPGP